MPSNVARSRRKFVTRMLISSREWEVWTDSTSDGGWFSYANPKSGGRRTITIGVKSDDPRYHAEILLHEIIEIILETDGKRYINDDVLDGDHTRYLFVFDHDYLQGIGSNLLTALLTSGFFEVKERK